MGVVIFGILIWLPTFVVIQQLLGVNIAVRFFLSGAIGILAMAVIRALCLLAFHPVLHLRKFSLAKQAYFKCVAAGFIANLIFALIFYQFVTKTTPEPLRLLTAGMFLFTMQIPQHLFRLWTRREAPDRYAAFINSFGRVGDRFITTGLALMVACYIAGSH